MKIYKKAEPPTLMRVNIKKAGYRTEHVAIQDASQDEVLDRIKILIERQGLSIFCTGRLTTVEVRESINGENGKVKSFSFKGLDPCEVKELIVNHISA